MPTTTFKGGKLDGHCINGECMVSKCSAFGRYGEER